MQGIKPKDKERYSTQQGLYTLQTPNSDLALKLI